MALTKTKAKPATRRVRGPRQLGGGELALLLQKADSAKTPEEKGYYDWMSYVAMFMGILNLIPLPFAGYWLMREIYGYRQQMGITLMGGLLAWVFIMQAMIMHPLLAA